ncbi:helix-turn-helix domain-containing protein [Morganella morganii]|nr:helix-turn-helix domain-containing protein [Morganella morganii]MBC3997018.1 helix-turn-helix domain-containing protein [Morganella morganii]
MSDRRRRYTPRRGAKEEKIIADFLNVSPAEIQPSRYMYDDNK